MPNALLLEELTGFYQWISTMLYGAEIFLSVAGCQHAHTSNNAPGKQRVSEQTSKWHIVVETLDLMAGIAEPKHEDELKSREFSPWRSSNGPTRIAASSFYHADEPSSAPAQDQAM